MPRSSALSIRVCLLALVLVSGCTASPPIDDASARGTTAAQVTTTPAPEGRRTTAATTTSPARETSGAGGTRTRVVEPAVSVPKLPIGGAGQGSEHEQCVSINLRSEQPLPPGVRITVTEVSLTPPLLAVGGSACAPEEIPCLGAGFAFTADAGSCFVPVRGTGPEVDPGDEDAVDERVRLAVAAVVRCPAGQQQTCAQVAAALPDDRTIELDIRVPEAAGQTTGTTTWQPTQEGGSATQDGGQPPQEGAETTGGSAPGDGADPPTG